MFFLLSIFCFLLFFGALLWARGRDPFERVWFTVRPAGQPKADCVAVLPKTELPSKLPVVIYLHGSGGNLLGSGDDVRAIAEMGLATVNMDYEQKRERRIEDGRWKIEDGRSRGEDAGDAFDAPFTALLEYVGRQRWADTNRVAWVGYSLGAQRLLSYALRHPERRPSLLVRLAGGWVEELNSEGQRLKPEGPIAVQRQVSQPSTLNSQPSTPSPAPLSTIHSPLHSTAVLLMHGEQDEVFPLSVAKAVADCLQTNGVPVELRVLPGEGHGFGDNRAVIFRVIGEQCLTRLKGPEALLSYRSILSWQAAAWPLWVFWLPAFGWAGVCLCWRRRRIEQEETEVTENRPLFSLFSPVRVFAVLLAVAALALTALHVITPRLPVSERTLSIARRWLISAGERSDFDFLAAQPIWHGKPLKTLLEHVQLANYNRQLVNWKLDEQVYRNYVLSPKIDPATDGDLDWRRELWENCYPRIRRESNPAAAAETLVRFLRARITIVQRTGHSAKLDQIWRQQLTDARGFETVCVAVLRAAGVPSRLRPEGLAEFWTGVAWQIVPQRPRKSPYNDAAFLLGADFRTREWFDDCRGASHAKTCFSLAATSARVEIAELRLRIVISFAIARIRAAISFGTPNRATIAKICVPDVIVTLDCTGHVTLTTFPITRQAIHSIWYDATMVVGVIREAVAAAIRLAYA